MCINYTCILHIIYVYILYIPHISKSQCVNASSASAGRVIVRA